MLAATHTQEWLSRCQSPFDVNSPSRGEPTTGALGPCRDLHSLLTPNPLVPVKLVAFVMKRSLHENS